MKAASLSYVSGDMSGRMRSGIFLHQGIFSRSSLRESWRDVVALLFYCFALSSAARGAFLEGAFTLW